jgi:rRNA maturation endonuclease Nob1
MAAVKCVCAVCQSEFEVKVQDTCGMSCGGKYREMMRRKKNQHRPVKNLFNLLPAEKSEV